VAVTRIKNNQITDSTITGGKIASATLTGGLFSPTLSMTSNVTIVGNLTVTGTTSTVSSTNTFINDPLVVYNNGYTGSLSNYSIGMLVNRNLASLADYGSVNMAWAWDESAGAFTAMATTDTGTGITSINNSGWGNVKLGNAEIVSKLTASSMVITTLEATNLAATTLVATNFSSGNAQVSGGYADGFTIGANTAATATFTDVTSSGTATMNTVDAITTTSGTVNSTTGNITTLTSTTVNAGTATAATLNSTSGNVTTLTSTTVNAGTATAATLNSTSANITTLTAPTVNAGTTTTATLNATTGNVTTATAGSLAVSDLTDNRVVIAGTSGELEDDANFTFNGTTLALTAGMDITGDLDVDNINVNGNSITSTDTNGDINITPDGTGDLVLDGLKWPQADGTSNQAIVTDASGQLSFLTVMTDVVQDTTPQLGGDLDVNGNDIVSVSNGDINLTPDGTGEVVLSTAAVSDLTNNRVVIAGTSGALEDDANFTYDGTDLTVNSAIVGDLTNNRVVIAGTSGALEDDANFTYDGTDLTVNSAIVGDLTDNRVVIAGTSGALEDDANLTYDGTTLTTNGLTATDVINTTLVATNFSSANVDVNGGAIDGTTIGAASASTGAFTTLTASGATTLTATTTSTTTGTGALVVSGGVGIAENLNVGGDVTITGDLTVLGDATTFNVSDLTVEDKNIIIANNSADATAADGASISIDLGSDGFANIFYTQVDDSFNFNKNVNLTELTLATLNATAGNITTLSAPNFSSSNVQLTGGYADNVHIGANTAATGTFTTVDATTATVTTVNAGTTTSATLNATTGNVTTATAGSLAVSDLTDNRVVIAGTSGELEDDANLTYDGTNLTTNGLVATTGTVTTLNAGTTTSATVNATTGNVTTISGTTATYTTVNAGTTTSATLNATTGNVTTLTAGSATVSDLTDNRIVIAGTSGALEDDANLTWDGSDMGVTGGVNITGDLAVDNLALNGNDITSTDTNGDINITPDGTGEVVLSTAAVSDLTNNRVVIAGTSGALEDDANFTYDGTDLTVNSAIVGDLTDNRVVIAGTSGALEDDANLTYDGTNLTTNGLVATTGTVTTLNAGTTTSATLNSTTGNITTLTSTTVNAGTTTSATVNATTGNVTTLTSTNGAVTTLVATNFSSGNVDINGGAIDGTNIGAASAGTGAFTTLDASANLAVSGGALINTGQNANYDIKVSGVNDTSLVWARSASAYDAVLIGNSASASTFVSGAKLQINTTDSILLPAGTTAQRPGSVGGTDTTGMLRYNTSISNLEFYDGDSWNTAGTTFTVIASQTFDGDDSTTGFTLSEAQTTASCIVSINGVVQLPSTAYSVSGTTLTFTEAPATGDKIEVRKLTTTQSVTGTASANGYVQVATDDDGIKFYAGSGAATLRWTINTDGDLIPAGNTTQDIGSASSQIGAIYVAGGTIHLGELQLKDNGDNTLGIFQSDGSTPAGTVVNDFVTGAQGDVRFMDADSSNFVAFQAPATVSSNVTWTLPSADAGTSGYALVSDAAGTLSWAAAGATITQDEATNTNFNLYFASTTSGALTAVKYDTDLSYNPGTGRLNVPDLVVSGDLTVNGTTTTVATTNTVVTDNLIELNNGVGSNANDSGIVIERGSEGDNAFMGWDESADSFIVGTTTATGADTGDLSITAGNIAVAHVNATGSIQAQGVNLSSSINAASGTFSGNVTASYFVGTATQAIYADLAENYQGDKQYAAGTVVEFGGEHEVTVGQVEGSTRVAGIVSTNPAHLMNGGLTGTNVVAVALTGRVPCMVIGPVRKGDMMVSAGFGYAKASANPAVGSVVGKALENFDGDKGVIEVVVGRV